MDENLERGWSDKKTILRLLFVILILCSLSLQPRQSFAFFEEQGRYAFEKHWLPKLESPVLGERFRAMQAFLAFPEWGTPLLRGSLKDSGGIARPWRAAMLLGVLGNEEDLNLLLNYQQQKQELDRPDAWLGAIERLYWKTRIPPEKSLSLGKLAISKTRKPVMMNKTLREAASIQFQLVNRSSQMRLVLPRFDFWIGKPESVPELKLIRIKPKSAVNVTFPVVFRVSPARQKVRLDLRIRELGAPSTLIHQTAFLALNEESTP